MRIILYVRVSTQEQAKEGYSIEEQIDRLQKFCDAHKWIVVKIYTDAGYSGGNTDRPALQDLLKDVRAGKADKVLVYKLDRLSRSQKDTLDLIENEFLKNGVDFVSMSEQFDTSTPFGRAMIGILAVFAQLEREQIKERMAMGREGRVKKGKYKGGGHVPIGYDYVDGELVVNEYEAMQVREIFDSYQSGKSFRSLERIFEEKGYSHKHGTWNNTTISNVLENVVYLGKMLYHDQVFEGNHPAIISQEQFDACQSLRERRSANTPTNWSRATVLGGMLYCKQCGARYGLSISKVRGNQYRYYSCYTRKKASRMMMRGDHCSNKHWRQEDLDAIILGEIRKLSMDPDYILQIKEDHHSDDISQKIAVIKKEISNINEERSRFMKLYGKGTFTMEEIQEEVDALNSKREKLEAQLTDLSAEDPETTVEEVREIVSNFEDIIEKGSINDKIQLVQSLIDRIEIDGEDITIHWKFV